MFARAPDTQFEYSNLGYALLAQAITVISGVRAQDFVATKLLTPLGLASTGWHSASSGDDVMVGHRWRDPEWIEEPPPLGDGDFAAAGGLWSTVRDMCRWMVFFLDAFPPRDDADLAPLARASRRQMQQVQRARRSAFADGRFSAGGYGYGLQVVHDAQFGHIVGHAGGLPGFGSYMRWLPERGAGVVALANTTYAPMGRATLEALEALADAGALPAAVSPQPSAGLRRAQDGLVRLLRQWDERLAAELFAPNVLLDEEGAHRRAALQFLSERLGDFRVGELTVDSAVRARFTLFGDDLCAVGVVVLSPELPVRIMSYEFAISDGEDLPRS